MRSVQADGQTHIHTYIHTQIHTYVHAYIHTYRQTDVKREERKPTRCNNIDGLLSIMDVGY